ncbi:MAG: hypothetical protein NVSMB67_11740 [Flavisolibacter sp.]
MPDLLKRVAQWRLTGKSIAFTNGCFDILHAGHIQSFIAAAQQADLLVVGINADSSIKRIKGGGRPLNDEQSRATVLAALAVVDAVIIFSDPTPLQLIVSINPDVLVKGGDYKIEDIAGSKEVLAAGGRVLLNPILPGFSTSALINKIQKNTSN